MWIRKDQGEKLDFCQTPAEKGMLWATTGPDKGLEELNSPWGLSLEGEALAFHFSKWRSDIRHPISNVALLNANS